MTSLTLAWLLGAVLLVALVGCAVTLALLRDARRRVADLEERLQRQEAAGQPGSYLGARTAQAAHLVARVVETASRVREQGVGGMLVSSLDDFARWVGEHRTAIARIAAPDGTVSIFFSDIEGSTALNASLGDSRWVRVLSAHDDLVETYVEKYRGLVVKTQGDGHMVVFRTPALAINAALDIQRALGASWNRSRQLRRTPVRVRIGVHTGTAIERDGDYFGQNVALAARVAGEARGGEILTTTEIFEACAEEFVFAAAGSVELKGFGGTHDLWRVEGSTGRPGLPRL